MRPEDGEAALEPVYRSKIDDKGMLSGRALKSDRRLYGWIYHRRMPYAQDVNDVADAELSVGNMKPGKYTIEFWDTYNGTVISSTETEVKLVDGKSSPIQIKLPVVKRDLALKIKLK
jgi:hypothetical protein